MLHDNSQADLQKAFCKVDCCIGKVLHDRRKVETSRILISFEMTQGCNKFVKLARSAGFIQYHTGLLIQNRIKK